MSFTRRKRRCQATLVATLALSAWPCFPVDAWIAPAGILDTAASRHRQNVRYGPSQRRRHPCDRIHLWRTVLFEGLGDESDEEAKSKKFENDVSRKFSVSMEVSRSRSQTPGTTNRRAFKARENTRVKSQGGHDNRRRQSSKSSDDVSANRAERAHKKSRCTSEMKNGRGESSGSKLQGQQQQANDPEVKDSTEKPKRVYSSLLPPPLSNSSETEGRDDPLSTGLSSWEEFLGVGADSSARRHSISQQNRLSARKSYRTDRRNNITDISDNLPSIQELFPPEMPSSKSKQSSSDKKVEESTQSSSLDGVLPVSDLFYRSSQLQEEHDDEELPFSAEQSDSLTSDNNKIHIRRNLAKPPKLATKPEITKRAGGNTKKRNGRKMVRRGMEMLVGGVPINADPPQRSVELVYDSSQGPDNWAKVVSLNTLDFGPLFHTTSIPLVTDIEKGLFCEHFCHTALKWDVCPKDLREIVRSHLRPPSVMEEFLAQRGAEPNQSPLILNGKASEDIPLPEDGSENSAVSSHDEEDDDYDAEVSMPFRVRPRCATIDNPDSDRASAKRAPLGKAKGFGKNRDYSQDDSKQFYEADAELVFDLAVSKDELETGDGGEKDEIFKSVLSRAFYAAIFEDIKGFSVKVSKLILTDKGDGTTGVDIEFRISNDRPMNLVHAQRCMKRIGASFSQAVDDGIMLVAIAASAKVESRWPPEVRSRVVEECLFEDDEIDDTSDDQISADNSPDLSIPPQGTRQSREDLFRFGGRDGVFPDYSEFNIRGSPYRGELGLRLVEAVTQRAMERLPRVIVIGDVHGCIDELQDLLRQCDYRPGDLVVFLGDLVCKGPDSISVVQMAREIGAIGVRGNHDFEVIRWHQAIKSGVDPPVLGSEHFHIASCLTKADMKWLYTLPWYMSSKELGALFVHAGFVSGIRLAKQNPRLMMNMRSILPDGTVTSKFFNNWPWARLWDGPQTVLFGHDADRGLQQYEHAIGLDTGCVYGGRLTACILPEKRLVSVSARREYFKYRRKHYD